MMRVGTLVLFLTLGEMFQYFTTEDNVCCVFVIYSFYYAEVCSFLEKEMATLSSVLAWRIPGTGEPGGLPSMGLHRVGHD